MCIQESAIYHVVVETRKVMPRCKNRHVKCEHVG